MWVSCAECSMNVSESYLKYHMERLHGICVRHMRGFNTVGGVLNTYVVSFLRVLQLVICPVPG